MRKACTILNIMMIFCLFFTTVELDARGRGGGGGHGGGRGSGGGRGGGRSMNRSPSMSHASRSRSGPSSSRSVSRPQTRPASKPQSRPASRPQQRPQVSRPQGGQGRPGQPRPQHQGGQTRTRGEVQDFLKSRPATPPTAKPDRPGKPGDRPVQRPGKPGDRPGKPSGKPGDRPGRPGDRPGPRPGDRHDMGNKVRDRVGKDRPGHKNWFNDDFWGRHHHRPPYYRHHHPHYWWRWATVGGIGAWLGWNAAPVYYGYGDGGYYWVEEEYYGTPEGYTQQAQVIDTATAEATSEEWMPLGVFAFAGTGESAATPNIYLQLAISKDGMISGTYYNTITDETYEIEGMVDQESQRAAWKVVDKESAPIMETGIYNLTNDEVPVRINYVDGGSQDMMLVRLEEQDDTE